MYINTNRYCGAILCFAGGYLAALDDTTTLRNWIGIGLFCVGTGLVGAFKKDGRG